MPSSCLLWLKKDLRWHDHAALAHAAAFESAAALYIVEPEWLASPEFDAQHLAFALAALAPLREALAQRLWTYARDRAIARWCRAHGVRWQECAQGGSCGGWTRAAAGPHAGSSE